MSSLRSRFCSLLLACCLVLGLAGCGVTIESLGLPADLVLEKGETRQLELEYGTADEADTAEVAKAAEKLSVVWSSSDDSVVTVDETGLVTAVGAGEANVTAASEKADLSVTTHIKVVILPQGVTAPETLRLEINGETTRALGAVMTPEDATDVKLIYESSDESVATVDEAGNVTAVGVGECTIVTTIAADTPATAEDGELDSGMLIAPENARVETKVTVVKKPEAITLDSAEGVLSVGSSHTIRATVTPSDATDQALTWSSSNETVATVSETGKVTAKAEGSATITVCTSGGDVSASYALTVKKVTCSYCGASGHTSSGCPQKAADQAAAAAAQAAAQQQAEQNAPGDPAPAPDDGGASGGGDGGVTGGISHPEADIPGVIIPGDGNGDVTQGGGYIFY
ncbi:MAG TPA: Ig-like domain-containing protein [Candidatus Gemmiger faecavium]|nr:Ig-like domain-containing protein [Candidatus Gemmiger faecavium]